MDMVDPLSDEFDPSRITPELSEDIQRRGYPEFAGTEGAPGLMTDEDFELSDKKKSSGWAASRSQELKE